MDKHVESGVPVSEPQEEEQVLQPVGDQHPSQPGPDVDEQLSAHIQQEIERRFQSAKDKRWAQLEKQYGELSQLLEQKPLTQEKAEPAAPGMFERIHKLVQRAGLENDPRLMAVLQREDVSEDLDGYLSLLEDITSLVLGQAARQPASAAAVVQPGGGQAPLPDLRQSYDVRKRQLRPGDVDGLMALKREFRGKGLQFY
jgi:hypothetical protein